MAERSVPELPPVPPPGRRLRLAALLPALLLAVASDARAQSYEQTIVLQPGWNAVYLEVAPEVADVAAAFADLPVSSVWTPVRRPSGVEYIQDPAEGLFNRPGWLGYRPGDPPFLQSLFTLQVDRPYLVRLEGATERTWVVAGRPSLRDPEWSPDSFNLVGLPVDPASAIVFEDWFAASPAHAGQPVYRLTREGVWEQVDPATETIRSGEAYWVFCDGASRYPGPIAVDLRVGDGLEFGGVAVERRIRLSSPTGSSDLLVRPLPAADPVPLSWFSLDAEGNGVWQPLAGDLPVTLSAETPIPLELAVRRADFATESVGSVLEVRDAAGARRLVPVSADRRAMPPVPGGGAGQGAPVADPFAGLWVGLVRVVAVSEAQTGSVTPVPTPSEFGLRFIIHVDAAGQPRLLQHAIQLWEDGVLNPDGTVASQGRFVLVTDESRIPLYEGASLRDGDPVGFRVSTAAYSLPDDELPMTGSFDPAGTLSADLLLAPDLPTHPYAHRYHPDHDNLDAQFVGFQEEAFAITRSVELQFSATDPLGQNPPEWGDTLVGGVYRETVSGLHRNDIVVEGSFRLRRLVDTAELNP